MLRLQYLVSIPLLMLRPWAFTAMLFQVMYIVPLNHGVCVHKMALQSTLSPLSFHLPSWSILYLSPSFSLPLLPPLSHSLYLSEVSLHNSHLNAHVMDTAHTLTLYVILNMTAKKLNYSCSRSPIPKMEFAI